MTNQCHSLGLGCGVLNVDVVCVPDGLDLPELLRGDLRAKSLDGQHEFDEAQRIHEEVLGERRFWHDPLLLDE